MLCCMSVTRSKWSQSQISRYFATPNLLQTQNHPTSVPRSEEHTSELQSQSNLVCRLLLEKKQVPAAPIPGSCLPYRKLPDIDASSPPWRSASRTAAHRTSHSHPRTRAQSAPVAPSPAHST